MFIKSIASLITAFFLIHFSGLSRQDAAIGESIDRHRKGEIIVRAGAGSEVTVEQLSHEFWFGAAVANSPFNGSLSEYDVEQYKKVFLENFNSAVTENAVKWGNMERQRGEVNYDVVDAILEWTEDNNIPLRAHNLFWGIPQFVQQWVKDLPDDELQQTLKNRAITITSRYKGRFAEYDLNNEMIHGNYYEDRLGPDITRKMAEWARSGDPGIKIYLNDYDILTGVKLPEYMAHIRLLLSQGVQIDGIGVQGHLHAESFDRDQVRIALDSLAIFNLPVVVTEFNMPGQRSKYYRDRNLEMTPEEEELKARDLVDYYRICFAHPSVSGILMWGFWEGANWIPASSLYKRDWTPTPAAIAYQDLIFDEWWTSETGRTSRRGEYSTRAFFGKYRVTVDGKSKEVELTRADGRKVVEFGGNPARTQETNSSKPVLKDRSPEGIVAYMDEIIRGGFVISGQHCGDGDNIESKYADVKRLHELTGRKPALIGADYGWKWDNDFDVINRRLTGHWNSGGLVTVSWHANNPFSGAERYNPRINTIEHKHTIDLSRLLRSAPDSDAKRRYQTELKNVAGQLKHLHEQGVVVIWRPFHEMNGNWFWWGTDSFGNDQENVDDFHNLWVDMYDLFTNEHGLTNLVWVYSPHAESDWTTNVSLYYPGSGYVDLVGVSSYSAVPEIKDYEALAAFNKPLVMSEIGPSREQYGKYDLALLPGIFSGRAAYFLQWHSWTGAAVSIADNLNYDVLMNDNRIINLDDLNAPR